MLNSENDYDDLLGQWSDLEAGLAMLLEHSGCAAEFELRIWQYHRWLNVLLERDTNLGLYLLFQLASSSPVGYSASHALASAVLCHLVATRLELAGGERDALVHAAMTMNIAMTVVQNQLAGQVEPLSPAQQEVIRHHADEGVRLLQSLGVTDRLWLETVALHHDDHPAGGALVALSAGQRTVRVLHLVDRYAAMISPRKSREGRSSTDSARLIVALSESQHDEVGLALVGEVGLYPPGSYVRLDNQALAVVARHGKKPAQPLVALLVDETGKLVNPPRLQHITDGSPAIAAALGTAANYVHFNHHLILRLSQESNPPVSA